jgi:hypothetical protein
MKGQAMCHVCEVLAKRHGPPQPEPCDCNSPVDEATAELIEAASEAEELMSYDELEAEAFAAMFDDDPNPYHGDYSEM